MCLEFSCDLSYEWRISYTKNDGEFLILGKSDPSQKYKSHHRGPPWVWCESASFVESNGMSGLGRGLVGFAKTLFH